MKTSKFFYALAATTLLGLSACSSEEPVAQNGNGNVNFTVTLPDAIGTRAYSDGLSATHLDYYVYDEDNSSTNIAALNGTATFTDRKATVSLNLVSGKSYSIVFLATVDGQTYYTYTASTKDLAVTYSSAAQDEDRDAFYVYEPTFKVTGAINKDVVLKRPFAQINVGTTDWAKATAAGINLTETSMTVTGVANKINLGTGDVDGNDEVTFTSAAMPGDTETFPYAAAGVDRYMAMNYILVGADKTTVDVKLNTNATPTIDEMVFSQVPVQRNYRTNIYGALLTNPANYNVVINQDYVGDLDGAVMKKNADGTVTCLVPELPTGVTTAQLTGKGGVYVDGDGNVVTFEPTGAAVNAAMQQASEIYFAPNIPISVTSHQMVVPESGIVIHGNGATISGGEQDFNINQNYTEESTVNLTINNLNGVKVWGAAGNKATINITLNNCSLKGTGLADGGHSLVMNRGNENEAVTNIVLDGCHMENAQVGLHTIYAGTTTVKNCTFKDVVVPINIAKRSGTQTATVEVINCTFDKCGIANTETTNSAYDYCAPVRVVDNGGISESITLTVDNCKFNDTQSEWEILLMDYRSDKTWSPVRYTVTNCTPAEPRIRKD